MLIIKWLVSTLAVMLTAYIIPGVTVGSFFVALWISLFLGFLNAVVRPILIILTLPINILTLGLFIFVINASIVLLASAITENFSVDGFFTALVFSIFLSITSYLLHKMLGTK